MKTFRRNRLCLTHQQVLTGQVTILQFLMIFRQHQTNPIVEPRILTESVIKSSIVWSVAMLPMQTYVRFTVVALLLDDTK